MLYDNLVYIEKSKIHGWGLFARVPISKQQIITQAPGLIIGVGSYCPPELCCYTFPFSPAGLILSLGPPSLINSSTDPNSTYEVDEINKLVIIKAIRDIECNEEITLQYL